MDVQVTADTPGLITADVIDARLLYQGGLDVQFASVPFTPFVGRIQRHPSGSIPHSHVPHVFHVVTSASAANASITPKSLPRRDSLSSQVNVSEEGIAMPTSNRMHRARQSILFAGQNFILVLMKGPLSSHKK